MSLADITKNLVDAIDPDKVDEEARKSTGGGEPTDDQRKEIQSRLVGSAASVFNGELIELIDSIRRDKEQTIDHDNLDKVIEKGWSGDAKGNAEAMAKDFATYLEENRDEIEALTIFYSQPARRSKITYEMIRGVMDTLKKDRPKLAPLRVWNAYAILDDYKGSNPASELTALVGLIRRVCGIDASLSPYDEKVKKNFQDWIMKRHSGAGEKFNDEQMDWLRMIRDHIITSYHIGRDDLDMSPFDSKGGLGKMYQLFGEQMDDVINELNEALAA